MDTVFTCVLYFAAAGLLFGSFIKSKEKTLLSLKKALKMFISVLPQFVGILILAGLLLAIITPETIRLAIGHESGFAGMLISSALGSIVIVPAIVAFPIAAELLKSGAGVLQIVVFVSTLTTVSLITLPLEAKYLGKKLTLTRNSFSYLFSFAAASIMGAILV